MNKYGTINNYSRLAQMRKNEWQDLESLRNDTGNNGHFNRNGGHFKTGTWSAPMRYIKQLLARLAIDCRVIAWSS